MRKKTKQLATVYIRYKDADDFEVNEFAYDINRKTIRKRLDLNSYEFRLSACAAEFAEILRDSYWARSSSLRDLQLFAQQLINDEPYPKVKTFDDYNLGDDYIDCEENGINDQAIELLSMITKASRLKEYHSER